MHVIDKVLTLPTQPEPAPRSIVDIAIADPDNFSTLVRLVTAAGLVETLNGEGPFTVSSML